MSDPPVSAEADVAYVREHFVELGELSVSHGDNPAAVRTAIAEGQLPAPSYVLADGAEMVPEDYFDLVDEAGGLDRIGEAFLERYAAAAGRETASLASGADEWGDYLSGLYGVCLKRVTPEDIVRKSALVAELDELLANPDPETLAWATAVRERVDELDALERPFAPTYDRLRFGGPSSRDRLITETRQRYPELFGVGATR
jgi:hypothetical protein